MSVTLLLLFAEARGGPLGRYSPGSLDGKRPGVFWANTADFGQTARYEMVREVHCTLYCTVLYCTVLYCHHH